MFGSQKGCAPATNSWRRKKEPKGWRCFWNPACAIASFKLCSWWTSLVTSRNWALQHPGSDSIMSFHFSNWDFVYLFDFVSTPEFFILPSTWCRWQTCVWKVPCKGKEATWTSRNCSIWAAALLKTRRRWSMAKHAWLVNSSTCGLMARFLMEGWSLNPKAQAWRSLKFVCNFQHFLLTRFGFYPSDSKQTLKMDRKKIGPTALIVVPIFCASLQNSFEEKKDIECYSYFDTPGSMDLQVLVRSGNEFKIHPDQQKQWVQCGGRITEELLGFTRHVFMTNYSQQQVRVFLNIKQKGLKWFEHMLEFYDSVCPLLVVYFYNPSQN